jgi:hypothetical protein
MKRGNLPRKQNQKSKRKQQQVIQRPMPISYVSKTKTQFPRSRVLTGTDVFVSSVIESSSYADNSYPVNIGDANHFASGSLEAARYDNVDYEVLEFHWRPSKAVTTTAGQIGLAFDPNPNSSDPESLSKFQAYECSTGMASVYSNTIVLRVRRQILSGRKFIRCGPIGSDRILYDPGRLVVATQDCAADSAKLGFIEVKYRVRFSNFHLEPSLPIPYSFTVLTTASERTFTTNTNTPLRVNNNSIVNGLGISEDGGNGIFTLPCGQYHIIYNTTMADSANEDLTAVLEIYKNSAALTVPCKTTLSANCIAGGSYTCSLQGYVTSDGTDTFSPMLKLIGAAGTLTVPAYGAIVTIRALV